MDMAANPEIKQIIQRMMDQRAAEARAANVDKQLIQLAKYITSGSVEGVRVLLDAYKSKYPEILSTPIDKQVSRSFVSSLSLRKPISVGYFRLNSPLSTETLI